MNDRKRVPVDYADMVMSIHEVQNTDDDVVAEAKEMVNNMLAGGGASVLVPPMQYCKVINYLLLSIETLAKSSQELANRYRAAEDKARVDLRDHLVAILRKELDSPEVLDTQLVPDNPFGDLRERIRGLRRALVQVNVMGKHPSLAEQEAEARACEAFGAKWAATVIHNELESKDICTDPPVESLQEVILAVRNLRASKESVQGAAPPPALNAELSRLAKAIENLTAGMAIINRHQPLV